jgi:hypothetical protein
VILVSQLEQSYAKDEVSGAQATDGRVARVTHRLL